MMKLVHDETWMVKMVNDETEDGENDISLNVEYEIKHRYVLYYVLRIN